LYGPAFDPAATSIAVASDTVNGPLIAFRNTAGNVWAKEGSLNAGWTFEQGPGIQSFAVASDSVHGPLVAVLDSTGTVWAKEGSLDAGWTEEWAGGVTALAVASDTVHGPLIAVLDSTGTVWAKEGSLDAGWTFERGPGVQSFAVASDAVHGPLIAVIDTTGCPAVGCIGALSAKEGSLYAGWLIEDAYYVSEPTALAVASDTLHGLLIAELFGSRVMAKENSLSASWAWFYVGIGNSALAVASDTFNGPLLAVLDSTRTVWAKEGCGPGSPMMTNCSLPDTGWTEERSGETALAVASDSRNGPLIAVLDSTGAVWAKEGSVWDGWVLEKGP
jgi:hypothetical protein